jgi:hypothetical protein
MDIYEAVTDNTNSNNLLDNISMPLQCANYILTLQQSAIVSFDFRNGYQFTIDNRLNKFEKSKY